MALCGASATVAEVLPCEVIVHIFSFLSPWDRLRASSVCSRWRECLFYPSLWPELRLRLRGSDAERCRLDFLMKKCGSFVRELRVEFEGSGSESAAELGTGELVTLKAYVDEMVCVLRSVRTNRNLQKLSVFGDIYLQEQGEKQPYEIQQLIEEVLGNSKHLKWLSLGFMMEVVTPTTLAALPQSSANCIEHLSLLDTHFINKSPVVEAVELERFLNLRSLALDFCDFTADVTRVLANSNHVPLHRLSLLMSNIHALDNMPQDADWKVLTRHCANLHVYIMAFNVRNDILLRILKPSIPLERIHFDSSTNGISGDVVDLITQQYNKSLTHLLLIKDVEQGINGFPDVGSDRNEDPMVILAWKCRKLSHLSIHGYVVWAHNLIAIARLRGPGLQVLEVTEESINFDAAMTPLDGDPMHNLIEEVSLGLGKRWHPVMKNEILYVFSETARYFYKEMQRFSEGI
ncbi:F-box only protein 33 isoform X2 [Rhincodon typus]|uniref:F-box only protein 33 isoform X2 n=1 Tax=Rhincodon typus TaxID=259920 RepID=UPI0009A3E092|nr:F-box only protein 33 isoform X2 [Rhincodon typus]